MRLLDFNFQAKIIPSNFQKRSYFHQSFQFSESCGLAYSSEDGIYRCLTSFDYQITKLSVSHLFLHLIIK